MDKKRDNAREAQTHETDIAVAHSLYKEMASATMMYLSSQKGGNEERKGRCVKRKGHGKLTDTAAQTP